MSGIQSILEKAEREGAVRRIVTILQPPAGAPRAREPMPSLEPASLVAATEDAGAIPDAPSASSARVVRGATLSPRLVTALSPASLTAEQYRALRTRILIAETGTAVNLLLITSPGRADGKSLTVANLGLAMAQDHQRRICVVDADLRSPGMHRLFGLPQGPGLSEVLAGRARLEDALVTLEEHAITVLPAGVVPARPSELLGTTAMRRALEELRSRFDRVIVDTSPAVPMADVGILAPLVDAVVLVVRAGVTPKPAIHDAISAIDPSKLLGVVLNEAA
jgi:capsular exopolysaccharide synthesis family protein